MVFDDQEWLWGSGILIAASQDTEVYGNAVEGNFNGITLVEQDRDSGNHDPALGRWVVENNHVYGNVVSGGKSGAIQDHGDNSIYSANNWFQDNTYIGDVEWAWNNSHDLDWNSWRNTGNDTNGTHRP